MSWRDKTAVGILLLVARILINEHWRNDVKSLATHISVWAPKEEIELREELR